MATGAARLKFSSPAKFHSGPLSNQILEVCFFSKPRIPEEQNDG
jgi:hypothetical protein